MNNAKGKLYQFECFNKSCFGTIEDAFSCGAEATQVTNVFPNATKALANYESAMSCIGEINNTINKVKANLFQHHCEYSHTEAEKFQDALERIVQALNSNGFRQKESTSNTGRKIW
jgi:hypothetical protein